MDLVNKTVESVGLPKFFDHWRGSVVATVLCLTLVGCGFFYRAKGPSPNDPSKLVTKEQLDAEVIAFKAKAEAAYRTIELQENAINQALTWVSQLTAAVPGPWGGILTSSLAIAAAGLGLDNRRKDAVIQGTKIATRKK